MLWNISHYKISWRVVMALLTVLTVLTAWILYRVLPR